jgi:hypothetical protein
MKRGDVTRMAKMGKPTYRNEVGELGVDGKIIRVVK